MQKRKEKRDLELAEGEARFPEPHHAVPLDQSLFSTNGSI